MKNYMNIFMLVGLVIISGFVGYSAGNKFINLNNYVEKADYMSLVNKTETLEKNYAGALEKADRYEKAYNRFIPPTPDEIFSLNGKIKEITPQKIVFETPSLDVVTLIGEEPVLETRTILIDKNTKIVKIDPFVAPKIVDGELQILENNKINISDLNVSDRILVSCEENIKSKKEFTAKKISLIENNFPIAE